ncbi:MAG: Asp-tRNA(Asn)/Glu-tRNA(Gln) amidotransferase subunit GatC [Alphaproteobacteria bacterium]
MSQIDKNMVMHIARLAKIKLTEQEKARLIPELNKILTMVGELQTIDTSQTEPLMSILEVAIPDAHLPLQGDEPIDKNYSKTLLSLAPMAKEADDGGFFVVPKMVGGNDDE